MSRAAFEIAVPPAGGQRPERPAWRLIVQAGVSRRLRAGVAVPEPLADGLILVLAGAVKVVGTSANGGSTVLAVRTQGGVVGCLSGLTGAIDPARSSGSISPLGFAGVPRATSVVALVPSTVVTVPAVRFTALVQEHPAVALLMLEKLGANAEESDRRLIELACYPARERVCRVLCELVLLFEQPGASTPTVIPLVQQDLAKLAGVSRELTAQVLRGLRQAGAVRTSRSRVVVIRPDLIGDLS